MKNWKTTLFGGVPGLGIIIEGVITQNWSNVAMGVGLLLTAIFANDAGTSGTEF